MKKILHPFDQEFDYNSTLKYPVFICVEWRTTNKDPYFSFTGVQAPMRSGNAKGGCGQISMEYDHKDKTQNDSRYKNPITVEQLRFAKGWDAEMWYKLLDFWEVYHLKNIKDIPQDVFDWINSLPDTDRTPAWV